MAEFNGVNCAASRSLQGLFRSASPKIRGFRVSFSMPGQKEKIIFG
jgi:hypothetical protein